MFDVTVWVLLAFVAGALATRFFTRHWIPAKVQHHFDKKLETIKGEIQLSITAIQTRLNENNTDIKASLELLASTFPYKKSREVESIESLYKSMLKADYEFAAVIFCDWCVLTHELDKCVQEQDPDDRLYRRIRNYKGYLPASRKLGKCLTGDTEPLFVNPTLAGLHGIYLRVHARAGFLLGKSVEDGKVKDWRSDALMADILGELGGSFSTVVEEARSMRLGGLGHIVNHVKASFTLEAKRCIDGADEQIESASEILAGIRNNLRGEYSIFNS